VIERAATVAGDESDGGPCGGCVASGERAGARQAAFSVGPPKRLRLGYRLKLTLLPLTFPDDDAPEGGQLHNRIVGENRRISCGLR
jgi:hypothetical protein